MSIDKSIIIFKLPLKSFAIAAGAVNSASTSTIPTARIRITIDNAIITCKMLFIKFTFILSTAANSSSNKYALKQL